MHGSVVVREYRGLTHLCKKVWFLKTLPQSLMNLVCIPRGSCESSQKFWVQPFFAWRKLYIQKYLCLLLRPIQNRMYNISKLSAAVARELVCIASI